MSINEALFSYIHQSASMFHTVLETRRQLEEAGATYLPESSHWNLKPGLYYTVRNHSSLIAFSIPETIQDYHFQMTAAHTDSPTYKLKDQPVIKAEHGYLKLNVEGYGGMIDFTWTDRPLSIAGRVLVKTNKGLEAHYVSIDQDLFIIPNVPIHMNRTVNDGYKFNKAVDMCPLVSAGEVEENFLDKLILDELQVDGDIVSRDLFLVNRQPQTILGLKQEFIASPKLDDLQCAFVSLKAFLQAKNPGVINTYLILDNEEVGSNTKQGAMSTFVKDTLTRINLALGKNEQDYYQAIAKSFLVSCDNAHAVHPNHGELVDKNNCALMNGGIVIKESANQKYTTDAFSRAVFKMICEKANVPVQRFANRSDMVGGSTLGNLSNTQVSVHAVDIGLAQLAMHSSYEMAGAKDTQYAIDALTCYFSTNIQITDADSVRFS